MALYKDKKDRKKKATAKKGRGRAGKSLKVPTTNLKAKRAVKRTSNSTATRKARSGR
tara:strand:- start:12896 stop:13066 length:171 start_codon:yes stop_codon:yes gene_type:complete